VSCKLGKIYPSFLKKTSSLIFASMKVGENLYIRKAPQGKIYHPLEVTSRLVETQMDGQGDQMSEPATIVERREGRQHCSGLI
jgi:hypothetical protein